MVLRRSFLLVLVQAALALSAFATLALWPPRTGRLLLTPLGRDHADELLRQAIAGGALLLGAGPLPGSQVVIGDRAAILRRIRPWTVAVTAAPVAGCGVGIGAGVAA